jgi:hypothetical protein
VYVIHPLFSDEMHALMVVSFVSFSLGFLGFAYSSVMEEIAAFSGHHSLSATLIENVLRAISPAFLVLQALFCLLSSPENTNLWAWSQVGQSLAWLTMQSGLCLLVAMLRGFFWLGGLQSIPWALDWLWHLLSRCVTRIT